MYSLRVSAFFLLVILLCIQDSTGKSRKDEIKDILAKCEHFKACRKRGWVHVGPNCIRVYHSEKNLYDAEKFCRRRRSQIVTPRDAQQSEGVMCVAVKSLKRHSHQRFWIGATKKGNSFKWITDSKTVKYTNWEKDQPDFTAGEEKCIEMNWKAFGKWNDDRCWTKKFVVCSHKQ